MKKRTSTTVRTLAVAAALAVLSGCATVTQEDFDALKAEVATLKADTAAATSQATDARFLAEKAMDASRTANSCCAANTERMDRMFEKAMTK